MHLQRLSRYISFLALLVFVGLTFAGAPGFAATAKHRRKAHKTTQQKPSTTHARRTRARLRAHHPVTHMSRLRHRYVSPWTTPTFADSTVGDSVEGEDLVVRRAAVQALGPYNGSVVVVDPATGRILTVVNQKLAFQSGFEPCSTVKLSVALAGLSEGVIDRNTLLQAGMRRGMTLTEAIAHSNNYFFATVGTKLGFDKVQQYQKLFGLGEKATSDASEQAGTLPDEPPKSGVGMMTSFGEGIYQSPLQLASLVTAIANGGTMYVLQRPHSQEEAEHLTPKVKRQLDISDLIPEMKPGMMGAVEYGTARRANFNPDEPIYGKTGTCTDLRSPTHLGWFGSFNEVGKHKLAVVVLLTGGRPVNGPVAAGVAGAVYRNLAAENYFGAPATPLALISAPSCCAAPLTPR